MTGGAYDNEVWQEPNTCQITKLWLGNVWLRTNHPLRKILIKSYCQLFAEVFLIIGVVIYLNNQSNKRKYHARRNYFPPCSA
jgi:hypothetical protein